MKFSKLHLITLLLFLPLFSALIYSQSIINNQNSSINNSNSTQSSSNKRINNYYKNINTKTDYNKSAVNKIKNKDFNGAKSDLEKAISLNPKDAKAHLSFALLLVNSFNDLSNARKHFDASLALDPKNAKAHYDYAVVLKVFYKNKQAALNQYIIATKLKSSLITQDSDKFFGIKR